MRQTFIKIYSTIFKRVLLRNLLNILCRFGMVIGCIAFIGIWGGMEFGELLIGRRLLWSVADILLICALAQGEALTGGDPNGIF